MYVEYCCTATIEKIDPTKKIDLQQVFNPKACLLIDGIFDVDLKSLFYHIYKGREDVNLF